MSKPKNEKKIEDTRKFAEMVANKNGWKLTPDVEFLNSIIEGLNSNYNRHGYYCCPCRDGDGIKEQDKDIICPCDYCIPDQKQYGHCYCGLYLTQDFYDSGKETQGIPERRPL